METFGFPNLGGLIRWTGENTRTPFRKNDNHDNDNDYNKCKTNSDINDNN